MKLFKTIISFILLCVSIMATSYFGVQDNWVGYGGFACGILLSITILCVFVFYVLDIDSKFICLDKSLSLEDMIKKIDEQKKGVNNNETKV